MAKRSSASPVPLKIIRRLLIANRGEIVGRIIRSAKRLGIETVAVYSDADRDAPHVSEADTAYHLGPSEARASYLNQEKLIAIAQKAQVDAVHPGYGFLSENADFAERCAQVGLIFVGPPASAIRAMGDKAQSKAIMEQAGVPLVPGYHGEEQDAAFLRREAEEIGYPVLIKASAGGGGKGMKIAETAAAFEAALASAKREAMGAFGDDRILLEKYLTKPRHVEMQIFADQHENCIHLYDRDCSLQRRYQKVLEEAPAPNIPPDIRTKMQAAAVRAAQAIGYVGAGTLEFLYSEQDQQFFFMEMNTRLQVEHPVTEAVTGIDLVEWQLQVAAGKPLPKSQQEIKLLGHAVEVRLYAEDPVHQFLPQTGQVTRLAFPDPSPNLRIDAGVMEGSVISIHYDPMIAKMITSGPDRITALRTMQQALDQTYIGGVTNNVEFLNRLVRHEAFAIAALETGFIEKHRSALLPEMEPVEEELVLKAAFGLLLSRRLTLSKMPPSQLWDPWQLETGWRLNEEPSLMVQLNHQDVGYVIFARDASDGMVLTVAGSEAKKVFGSLQGSTLLMGIDGAVSHALWFQEGKAITVIEGARRARFNIHEEDHTSDGATLADEKVIRAPMPGRVTALLAEKDALVEAGQTLLIVEAMKMEHALKASRRCKILDIRCQIGDQVEEAADLIVFEAVT